MILVEPSAVRLSVAVLLKAPVAPPIWKATPPETTLKAPPPLMVMFVVALALGFKPTVTAPLTVRVLPLAMTTLATPLALVLVAWSPAMA